MGNAKNLLQIYTSRFISGFAGGITTASLIYVSEIVHRNYRAMMLSVNSVAVCFGILLTCVLSKWFAWNHLAHINFGVICLSLLMIFFIPESPYWLWVFKKNAQKSSRALKRLYGNNEVRKITFKVYFNALFRFLDLRIAVSRDIESRNEKEKRNWWIGRKIEIVTF